MVTESQEAAPAADRKLGDEWQDWDGQAPASTTAGKRLFFALTAGALLLLAGAALFGWYMVTPRLAQWHPAAPGALLALLLAGFGVTLALFSLVAMALLLSAPLPGPVARLAQRLFSWLERAVFSVGKTLSVNRDRIAHSFVRVHNTLVRSTPRATPADRVLILLPRCLAKTQLQEITAMAKETGVKVAVVAGGELARKRIKEHRPEAIIGVACERDLLSGIKDVQGKARVLGIANTRPHGPCKDTHIDLAELRATVAFCLGGSASPPSGSTP